MSLNRNKKDREKVISDLSRSTPFNLDVIDKGDHLEVNSCSKDLAAWWMGTLRASYPQDHYSGTGSTLKMHPEMGVTLKLNRDDGTLKIKGRKHLQWFCENFDRVLESGNQQAIVFDEFNEIVNKYLKVDDGFTLNELLDNLPSCGAVKHGPSYVYRIWKGLLDKYLLANNSVYIVSPMLDSKRMADIILLLSKHKQAGARATIFTMTRCDADVKYPKVLKEALRMIRELKAPNKKRLIPEDRLRQAKNNIAVKYGRFHCKFIACIGEFGTEMLMTSANFHGWHFHHDSADLVQLLRMTNAQFSSNYLQPLGLAPHYGSLPLLPSIPSSPALSSISSNDSSPTPSRHSSTETLT